MPLSPAVFDQTVIEIEAGRVGLRATGQVMRFAGYLAIYAEAQDEGSPDDESTGSLPDIHPDETLRLLGCQPEQHFTQPPPRFLEATLVRELEEKGIGRPSTYATILSTIQDRGQALPAVWRRLRGAESVACGRAPALPGPGLRLDGRARRRG